MNEHIHDGRTTEVTEASSLGWRPGEWPDNFMHDGYHVYRANDVRHDGELVAVIYRSRDGMCELEVLND